MSKNPNLVASVQFDETMAREILASAMLQVITPERREELLRNGIKHVLEERDRRGADETTRLDKIFREVVYDYAKEHVKQLLEKDPELNAQLERVTRETIEVAFKTVHKHLGDTIVGLLKQAMERRY